MCEAHHTVTTYRIQSTARSTLRRVAKSKLMSRRPMYAYCLVQQFNVRGVTGAPYRNDVQSCTEYLYAALSTSTRTACRKLSCTGCQVQVLRPA